MNVHDEQKRAAARRALELVESGMLLGIGSGTTARFFIQALGERVATGLRVSAVATSRQSEELARSLGIAVIDDPSQPIDLAVDGADEIDPQLRLIKGHGGALFREKLVASSARRFIVIADASKLARRLGRTFVPVEILPFLWRQTARRLAALGAEVRLRAGPDGPYRTDNGNLILDLTFAGGIEDPEGVATAIKVTTGVLEHGLFLGLATGAIVAEPQGLRILGSLS
ncbi:MAG TPA: ribose-5-phosphate isomerase RpiA [Candidatus Dormibacteraeota bacterium]|nr:ribose-5-phosphate isomerase RpiA [Candidatus Dormibacteraeota bacterium]